MDDIRLIAENIEDTGPHWVLVRDHVIKLIKEYRWENRFRVEYSEDYAFEIVAVPSVTDEMANMFGQTTILNFDVHPNHGNVVFWSPSGVPPELSRLRSIGSYDATYEEIIHYYNDMSADKIIIQYLKHSMDQQHE